MGNINRNIKKRRIMDKVEQHLDSEAHWLNKRDYKLLDLMTEFYVNDAPWLVDQRPHKTGVFKRIKPRVK